MKTNVFSKIVFLLIFLISFLTKMTAQLDVEGYENKYIDDFRYGLFVPPDYNADTAYHLMIWLHGYSYLADDNHHWYSQEWQDQYPTIVLTPKCETSHPDGWGNSYYTEDSWCMAKAFQAYDSTLKYYNIDTTRMHVAGSSMGGIGTIHVLASRPGMFASAWVECGGGNASNYEPLLETPLWFFHGDQDNSVPFSYSRDLYQNIRNAGGTKVRYTRYRGVGHNVWDYVPLQSTLQDWLFSQQLGAVHEALSYPAGSFAVVLNDNNLPELSWTAAPEPEGIDNYVWAYQIYRNSELLETVDRDSLRFIDLDALPGTSYTYSIAPMNYFFLEAPSSDELTVITEELPTEISDLSQNSILRLFPNPVKDVLHISGANGVMIVTYTIYTADGRLKEEGRILNNQINCSALDPGIYIVSLRSETGFLVEKIAKY